MSGIGRFAMLIFGALLALGVVAAVAAVGAFVSLSQQLPDPHDLDRIVTPEESIIYARDGKTELARFGQFQREIVDFKDIPPVLVDATTAVEDKTFWDNPGFDPVAIAKAGVDTIRGNGRGASTITQQLVRQRLLDERLVQDPNRTAERKLKEIVQSIRLTEAYQGASGKQAIMAAYLNQNYYGNEAYGVKAAARAYFGVDLSKLSLAQAAILAAIPQAPSSYDLVQNADEACAVDVEDDADCPADKKSLVVPASAPIVQRRNLVLQLMEEGRTPLSGSQHTKADFEAARKEPVVLAPQRDPVWRAPHFVWAVRQELASKLCGADAQTCPELETGGLRVTTTIDMDLQTAAEKWVQAATIVPKAKNPAATARSLGLDWNGPDGAWMRNLRDKNLGNGALVALDYQTGEIVSYVGSARYYATPTRTRQPKFDVLSRGWRQPGSAFKPVLYSVGIDEKKLTAGTMFMDVVTDFGGGYTPTDADNTERGPVRLRDALRFSLNIPAVKATQVLDPARVFSRAKDLGLTFQTAKPSAGPALGLGVQEVHPIDLVTAYATIADGGRKVGHTSILRVTDRNGVDVLPPYQPPTGKQAISPQASWIMTDILRGNTDPSQNPFWGKFGIGRGWEATLKTGTNNDAKDLNAYGFIPPPSAGARKAGQYALAVGVWNGNSDNSLVSTAGRPLFSLDVSTFVWQGFLRDATKGWKARSFGDHPGGVHSVAVDPWTGLLPASGGKSVNEWYITGTEPKAQAGGSQGCGQGVLQEAGFEKDHPAWLQADRQWIQRARRGSGVVGGPENTATAFFYNGLWQPYGTSWGPVVGGSGSGCATSTPSSSCPGASASADATAASGTTGSACPTESPTPTPTATASPTATPSATPQPTATPTATPEPTPTPTPKPTPPPTPAPTPTPTPTAPPAASAGTGNGNGNGNAGTGTAGGKPSPAPST
ncbi:MAG: transglycosylase domain-containing protein [Chloroflexota bacterium]